MNANSTQSETIEKACNKLAEEMSKLLTATRDPSWLNHNTEIANRLTAIKAMTERIFELKGMLSEINK